jgi:flagellar hook assembly protein FlgD
MLPGGIASERKILRRNDLLMVCQATAAASATVPGATRPRRGAARAELTVYDVAGRLVRTLLGNQKIEAGRHQVVWNGKNDSGRTVAPGVYYYRLQAGDCVETKRMMLLK